MGLTQKPFEETEEFKFGDAYQRQLGDLLRAEGCYVIPSYDYKGDEETPKAPRMHGLESSLIIPDLDVSKHGKRVWIEAKAKSTMTVSRKLKREEQGFDRHCWEAYVKVEKISGTPVWIYLLEKDTRTVLTAPISKLKRVVRNCFCQGCREGNYRACKMSRRGMVFFPRSAFSVEKRLTNELRTRNETQKYIAAETQLSLPWD